MKDVMLALTKTYAPKGILVDSNLLLLFLIGAVNRDLIQKFKRTKHYLPEDYDTLVKYLSQFSKRVTTPNVLTEVSNLGNSLPDNWKASFQSVLQHAVQILDETYMPSNSVVATHECARFGLTDSAITALVKGKYLLLTDDLRLSQYFQKSGGDAVNFNHIRTL